MSCGQCFFAAVLAVGLLTSPALASTFTTIDFPGALSTLAVGINDHGQIVGHYSAGGRLHGFLLDKGAFTTIDVRGAVNTCPAGINNRGQIVGSSGSCGAGIGTSGFLLDKGTFITIEVPGARRTFATGINDRGQIVGYYSVGVFLQAFLLD